MEAAVPIDQRLEYLDQQIAAQDASMEQWNSAFVRYCAIASVGTGAMLNTPEITAAVGGLCVATFLSIVAILHARKNSLITQRDALLMDQGKHVPVEA